MQQQHESELVLQVSPGAAGVCPLESLGSTLQVIITYFMQELELLDEDSNIFKLIGPVLIKQDPLEAKTNVKKRLEFIKGESDRLDAQCKRLEDKQHKRQSAVSSLAQRQLRDTQGDAHFACGLLNLTLALQAGCRYFIKTISYLKHVFLFAGTAAGVTDSTDCTVCIKS